VLYVEDVEHRLMRIALKQGSFVGLHWHETIVKTESFVELQLFTLANSAKAFNECSCLYLSRSSKQVSKLIIM